MNLAAIERIVLANIGFDKYSDLSVDTDAGKVEDFANLHTCVNLAREEIKLNTKLHCLTTIGATITVTAGTPVYSLPSGFDVPVAIYFLGTGDVDATLLDQYYTENLPASAPMTIGSATPETGTPYGYILAGTSSDLMRIYLIDNPSNSGVILPVYKPVLTELTVSTDEDVLMRKYPKVVIDYATAFAFQIIKKDSAQHDKYMLIGQGGCAKIDIRERIADSHFKELPDALTRLRRASRLSK